MGVLGHAASAAAAAAAGGLVGDSARTRTHATAAGATTKSHTSAVGYKYTESNRDRDNHKEGTVVLACWASLRFAIREKGHVAADQWALNAGLLLFEEGRLRLLKACALGFAAHSSETSGPACCQATKSARHRKENGTHVQLAAPPTTASPPIRQMPLSAKSDEDIYISTGVR